MAAIDTTPLMTLRALRWRVGEAQARLDLEIAAGEIVRLAGPSGSGKTTLLRVLARLHPRLGGEMLLEGVPAGRSAVTFRVENSLYMEARVFFDNTEIGRLADFLEGRGFIPAEPGEHEVILILCPSIRVMIEIITVPAGSVRVVTVK